jgi:hypothetical protein
MAAMSDATMTEALDDLERDGYTVFRNVVPRDQLAEFAQHLADEYDAARASGALFEGGGTLSGHLNCYPGERSRFVFESVRDAGILDVIERHSPGLLDKMRVTTNYNLPGSVAQHYHSDGLYTEEFLVCNVATVDTDLANGAIDVLPGTHARFYKFWQYALGRVYKSSTRLPLQQGDVLLRRSTVWHRGMPNTTDTPRPMMSLTFGEISAPDDDPFAVGGPGVVYTPNWYGTSRISQLREKTFVKVPLLYSSYRFARSLVGNKGYSSW